MIINDDTTGLTMARSEQYLVSYQLMHTLLPSRTVRLVTIAVVSFEIATTRTVG